MSTSDHNNDIVLEDQNALEDLLNVNGDPGPEPTLPPHVAAFLGKQLQAFYAHLMSEPVPDRLIQLLAKMDGQGNGRDGE